MIVTIQLDTEKDDKEQIQWMLRAQDLVIACHEFDNELRKRIKYPTPEQIEQHYILEEIRHLFGQFTEGLLP